MTTLDNISAVISPLIVAALKDNTTLSFGYFWVLMYFVVLSVILMGLSFYLHHIDLNQYDGVLSKVNCNELKQKDDIRVSASQRSTLIFEHN